MLGDIAGEAGTCHPISSSLCYFRHTGLSSSKDAGFPPVRPRIRKLMPGAENPTSLLQIVVMKGIRCGDLGSVPAGRCPKWESPLSRKIAEDDTEAGPENPPWCLDKTATLL